jgi:hypothetical protein
MPLHLLKLCVGCDSVEDLADWQAGRLAEARAAGTPAFTFHVTRMRPRREAELLDGGSLYWVIRGLVLVRQPILGLEPRPGADGVARCATPASSAPCRSRAAPSRAGATSGPRTRPPTCPPPSPRTCRRGSPSTSPRSECSECASR